MAECKYLYTYRPSGWVADFWCKSPCHPENLKGNRKTYLVSELKNLSYDCTHDSCINCKYYPNEINISKLSEKDKEEVQENIGHFDIGKNILFGILTVLLVIIIFGIVMCYFNKELGTTFIVLGLIISFPLAIYTKYVNG